MRSNARETLPPGGASATYRSELPSDRLRGPKDHNRPKRLPGSALPSAQKSYGACSPAPPAFSRRMGDFTHHPPKRLPSVVGWVFNPPKPGPRGQSSTGQHPHRPRAESRGGAPPRERLTVPRAGAFSLSALRPTKQCTLLQKPLRPTFRAPTTGQPLARLSTGD